MNCTNTSSSHSLFSRSFSTAVAVAIVTASVSASNWPAWRGPNQDGSSPAARPPVKWSQEDVAWKVKLPGKGGSTPIVWNERIYLTTPAEDEDAVMAFDLSGKRLWLTRLGPQSAPRHRTLGSSCNSSPVTDGRSIFVYFRSGHFAALDFDGNVRWKQNLTEKFGAEKLFWDQGSSPVVTDRHVILARIHQGES
ncbi:MAG TPA: Pyrrolo-quinoline quinone, partial [Verrucomicrobiales bacterium]|nr:Pyrrolo-quinoline quinone [Verrucomicrobiales bacterium]